MMRPRAEEKARVMAKAATSRVRAANLVEKDPKAAVMSVEATTLLVTVQFEPSAKEAKERAKIGAVCRPSHGRVITQDSCPPSGANGVLVDLRVVKVLDLVSKDKSLGEKEA